LNRKRKRKERRRDAGKRMFVSPPPFFFLFAAYLGMPSSAWSMPAMFDLSFRRRRERVLLIKTFRAPFRGDVFQKKGCRATKVWGIEDCIRQKSASSRHRFGVESHHIKKSEKNAKNITTKKRSLPPLPPGGSSVKEDDETTRGKRERLQSSLFYPNERVLGSLCGYAFTCAWY